MSALKYWSLLALTALLSTQSCSAYRATTFSEFVEPLPAFPEDHVALSPRPDPVPAPSPVPASGSYPSMPADGSEPFPARTSPAPPKKEISAAPITDVKNGAKDSGVPMNCGGGWCGPGCGGPGLGCGGGPGVGCGGGMLPPPGNPYYCQPARCAAYPGCEAGAGGGFTIYMDDHFVAGVSSSGNEHKS